MTHSALGSERSRPFTDSQYRERAAAVRQRMRERDIDVLYVTSPANLCYLTGYVASWYPPKLPVGVAISRHTEETFFFDWVRHAGFTAGLALFGRLVLFDYGTAPAVVSTALQRAGWLGGTVAFEYVSPTPSAPVTAAVAKSVAELGSAVIAGDWLVDGLRLYQSTAEVERTRRAARMADAALRVMAEQLRPGMTEMQVSGQLQRLLADQGSELAAQPALVTSGPRGWENNHAFPSGRVVEKGDVVTIDICGVVDRYHANVCRSFSLGRADSRVVRLVEVGAQGLELLRRDARIGEDPRTALAPAERYIRERVPTGDIWWIGGYSLGIAMPPSWVGHAYLAGDGVEAAVWAEGYVSNFETIIYDGSAGLDASSIDTVLMTRDGLEVLSELPREVMVI
jgi:Xaa-Pro aminopeptidase